ncbi:MAG: carbonic anhydrase [Maricaulaceae bacterium]|jgi:carbonic anhydrase
MRDIPELIDGYRRFLAGRYQEEAALYQALAREGQSPKTMILSCCDSRADPAAIFSARPGELFVARNVANLIPPYEPPKHDDEGGYRGASTALEFAVTVLEVENVVVMGHGRCGGVQAFIEAATGGEANAGEFISHWMALLEPAWAAVPPETAGAARQQALEFASIRQSIENLETFPFIHSRTKAGTLRLRGAYFDIADGKLLSMDPLTGEFAAVE